MDPDKVMEDPVDIEALLEAPFLFGVGVMGLWELPWDTPIYCGQRTTIIPRSIPMIIPTEQLLNIPGIRVLSVRVEAHSIKCEIESIQDYSLCHRCGQKATEFHGYD
jgi:hypothetical protein